MIFYLCYMERLNAEFKRVWDGIGWYGRHNVESSAIYLVSFVGQEPDLFDHAYGGRMANYRQFPINHSDLDIWNFKAKRTVGVIPANY